MRMMSFSMTTPQVRAKTKTVTRRMGWLHAYPGMLLCAIEKGQGLKKGEKVSRICVIRVTGVRRERIGYITDDDVAREGDPGKTAAWFIDKFCAAMRCDVTQACTRIEFEYVDCDVSQ